ncbi:ABC transporter ATP-binding protein [Streptomyces mangrovisoli]|uniref:ABC transporter domain-containing protein n=1 Tax=Streptomyces mangrovisoli TaxID=1428628 RepID=A0A1J4NRS8_9ACTN|nr:ABC transporter ATP-binding protein [Streptomyces mangrovisoli]OIJ65027.1 hypothetical protein WN71_025855 [Streptomyces mangrovisoli]
MSTTEQTAPLLEVRGLSIEAKGPDGPLVLTEGTDLTIRPGQTLGLVGESGSGKSMTGLAMLGVLPPSVRVRAGQVLLGGTDLIALPEKELRAVRGGRIGMVFQEPRRSLDPSFTVGDQVAETIRAHREVSRKQARNLAVELLDRVRIPDPGTRAGQYPHQFSGGMCQRVMLAVALAGEPEVLIADEPTTALDVTVQAAMLRLIKDLQEELNLGVLLITHDMGVVAEVCDDVAVMYAGQVAEVGPVRDVLSAPRHPYSAALRDATPDECRRGELLQAIPGQIPPPSAWPSGCRFHPRCSLAVDACREAAPDVLQLGRTRVRCARATENLTENSANNSTNNLTENSTNDSTENSTNNSAKNEGAGHGAR